MDASALAEARSPLWHFLSKELPTDIPPPCRQRDFDIKRHQNKPNIHVSPVVVSPNDSPLPSEDKNNGLLIRSYVWDKRGLSSTPIR